MASLSSRLLLITTLAFSFLWLWERQRREQERHVAEELREKLGQDLLKVIRNQRHGFINHLQVISGWLQLGRPEHVLEYIDSIRQKREQESQILRVKNLEMLGLLLGKSSLAEAAELDVRWEVEGGLVEPPALWVEALGAVLEALISALAREGGPQPLAVRLIESEKEYSARLSTNTHLAPRSQDGDMAGLLPLASRVREAGGRWVEELAPAYTLELTLPARSAVIRHTRAR